MCPCSYLQKNPRIAPHDAVCSLSSSSSFFSALVSDIRLEEEQCVGGVPRAHGSMVCTDGSPYETRLRYTLHTCPTFPALPYPALPYSTLPCSALPCSLNPKLHFPALPYTSLHFSSCDLMCCQIQLNTARCSNTKTK